MLRGLRRRVNLGRAAASPSAAPRVAVFRLVLALLIGIALWAAIVGGLLRASLSWAALRDSSLGVNAEATHAALMLSGFLGTVIAAKRAVWVKQPWAHAAPLLSGLGGLCLLGGASMAAACCMLLAALLHALANAWVMRRQASYSKALLLAGALAWLIGNLLFAAGADSALLLPWWFAFPVLTIVGERLEMTALLRHQPLAGRSLSVIAASLLLGAALMPFAPRGAALIFGAALAALAVWLGWFDIFSRKPLAHGLSRYIRICCASGYVWLGVAGLAWVGMALGCPGRDLALHALGLGFIVSLLFGHAPVILPALARISVVFSDRFYLPLWLLQGSLLLRLFGGIGQPQLRFAGACLNASALLLFAALLLKAALDWRRMGRRWPGKI